MPEKPMTARAGQREAPASDEAPANEAEGAIPGPLGGGGAHPLLPGDGGFADADGDGQTAGGGAGGSELELELVKTQMAQKPALRRKGDARSLRVRSVSRGQVLASAGMEGAWVGGRQRCLSRRR
jgi:hypothetical protein